MQHHYSRSEVLAAIDRRLWRDLGFSLPEPDILPLLPSLVVAWADATVGERERERIAAHAATLPSHLAEWLSQRLAHPPGPYFRYQVAHLLSFMVTAWQRKDATAPCEWAEQGEEWAQELIDDAGWMRRLFGGVNAERRDLDAIVRALHEHEIVTSDRIWALARGTHAEAEPRRGVVVDDDPEQVAQALGIVLETADERLAVGTYGTLVHDDDLVEARVEVLWARGEHLREPERWALLAEEVNARGRPLTRHQADGLRERLAGELGGAFDECGFSELAYLEDALASDARWMSWVPGRICELSITRERVTRASAPGTFDADRHDVRAHVAQQPVMGPPGLGFRILVIEGPGQELRLASPIVLQEPATRDTIAWLARFLPQTCDPRCQLVLDEQAQRWVAEVHSSLPDAPAPAPEPLGPGRALLVPPWVWFRAANALGVRFFSGKRKTAG